MFLWHCRHKLLPTFICSYNRLAPIASKRWEKKELEIVFQLLWSNINQLSKYQANLGTFLHCTLPFPYVTPSILFLTNNVLPNLFRNKPEWWPSELFEFTKIQYLFRISTFYLKKLLLILILEDRVFTEK